jgi:hypothetical protein
VRRGANVNDEQRAPPPTLAMSRSSSTWRRISTAKSRWPR